MKIVGTPYSISCAHECVAKAFSSFCPCRSLRSNLDARWSGRCEPRGTRRAEPCRHSLSFARSTEPLHVTAVARRGVEQPHPPTEFRTSGDDLEQCARRA